MLVQIKESTDKILDYIGEQYNECLYLYLNCKKYGISNPNIKIWVQTNDNSEYTAVVLKYYTGMHIFSKHKDIKYDEINNLIRTEKPTIICAESTIIKKLESKLNNYYSEYGWIRELTTIDEEYGNYDVCTDLSKEELEKVVSLIMDDEMGNSHTFESLYQQLDERKAEGYGRNYIISEEERLISHASTGAESDKVAVLTYIITDPEYRGKGYAEKVTGRMCYDLIKEGKRICLINYTEESTRLYDKLGFKTSAKVGKLVLKK